MDPRRGARRAPERPNRPPRGSREPPANPFEEPPKRESVRERDRRRADEEWLPIQRNLELGGVPAKDREVARRYFDRNVVKVSTEPRPAPISKKWRANETYATKRGYYYQGANGRWRTPDGTRYAPAKVAKRHNAKHHARLVKQDAYYGLLARGAPVKRKEFDAATRRLPKERKGERHGETREHGKRSRESIAEAVQRSRIIERSLARADAARERGRESRIRDEPDADYPRASYTGAPDRALDEERAHMASMGGDAGGSHGGSEGEEDEESSEGSRFDDESFEEPEYDFDPGDIYDDWFNDFEDSDGGDTP